MTLRRVFICLRPRTPYPPPLTHCVRVYSTRIHTGKGGEVVRVGPERRLEGQRLTKLERKYQYDRLYLRSINSDKHLYRSIFLDDNIHFALVSV
jgi:hypothetical protein